MKNNSFCAALVLTALSLTACQNTSPIDPSTVILPVSSSAQTTNTAQTLPLVKEDLAPEINHVTAADLSRYQWTLVSAVDSSNLRLEPLNAIKDQVKLSFGQLKGVDVLRYTVGCNTVTGRLQLVDSVLRVQEGVSTKMFCEDLDDAEKLLNHAMQGDSQLTLKQGAVPILTQLANANTTLVWRGVLSSEAKYGKAEMVFWAVDHEVEPCPDGTTRECLKVKPIRYDTNGAKLSEGEWTLFDGEIEGYTHDSEHDQVLRLKHYTDGNKKAVYVLDTVVESLLVK